MYIVFLGNKIIHNLFLEFVRPFHYEAGSVRNLPVFTQLIAPLLQRKPQFLHSAIDYILNRRGVRGGGVSNYPQSNRLDGSRITRNWQTV